jgi:tetratricopeptide (TPR) repeat protein
LSSQNNYQKQINKYKEKIEAKKYDCAINIIKELLESHPEDKEELLNDKGLVHTKKGEYDAAIADFDSALEISENKRTLQTSGIILNNKGLAHCNKKEFSKAIVCFEKSYEINCELKNNEYTNVMNNKGLAYYYIGKNEKNKQKKEENFKNAINCFDKVIKLNPNNSNAYNNKGSALFELGWDEEASRCIYKSLELNPENTNALNNRGRILAHSEKYQQAIDYYNKVLKIDKSHTQVLNNKGIALAHLANLTDDEEYFEGAKDCYDEAIGIDNKFVHAINNKSMLYVMKGRYKKANEFIQQSIDIQENVDVDTIDKKGIILFHLKKYDKSLSWFKKATENNPENKISKYHMGNVYMRLKKYDEAIECFDDSLKDNLDFAEAHNAKASALFNKGNQKEASKEIKRAIEIKPSLAVANENIAKITSSGSQQFQNFWDFWKSSLFKKLVGITLFVLILSTAVSITYYIINNLLFKNGIDTTKETQLMDISEGYLIMLGIILFILLIPEIKKAKMGPMEFELQEQHMHPTNDSPSMSEEHSFCK